MVIFKNILVVIFFHSLGFPRAALEGTVDLTTFCIHLLLLPGGPGSLLGQMVLLLIFLAVFADFLVMAVLWVQRGHGGVWGISPGPGP